MIFNVCWPILYLLSAASAAAYTGIHFSYMISLVCMNFWKDYLLGFFNLFNLQPCTIGQCMVVVLAENSECAAQVLPH